MELLFYLGVLLPTLVVIVAFIVFLLCWFRLAARLPFCKDRRGSQTAEQQQQPQQQQPQHTMPPLPPVPQQPTLAAGQHRGPHQTISLDQLHQQTQQHPVYALDEDGRLLWDKYTVRDSMHSLYFGDRPQPAIPGSVTFPALAGFPALQHHSQMLYQQQQQQQPQQKQQQQQSQQHHSSKFAKSASCLFQTGRQTVRQPPGMVSSTSTSLAFGFRQTQPPPPPHHPPPPPPPQPPPSVPQQHPASTMITAIPGGRRRLQKSSSMEQPGGHGGGNAPDDEEDGTGQYQLTYSAFARTRTTAGRDHSDQRLFGAAAGKGGSGSGGGTSRDNSAGTSDPRTPSESASESERSHLVRPLPLRTLQHQHQLQFQPQFQHPLPPNRANPVNVLDDVHSSPESSPVIGESST
ncbi:hypothetical protein BOX15_Mlig007086g1 [Macrostomum lignano]|uniref:Uncharacterized protein n=1 Tax=Macrostomum lignano TaxID=282301 RepID=A0A267EAG5_9PLAT|nr:hypothetical protein BOX15_Mlig007086g1 [Macrostomum lignano]